MAEPLKTKKANEKMEIERRWLLTGFPEGLPLLGTARKEQGYLCTRPVVRIRRETDENGTNYILCVKGKGLMAREEIETPLDEDTFGRLARLIGIPLICKDMRFYRLPDGHTLECSHVDEGEDTAFYYAEVEFASIEEAKAFQSPAFLNDEKTESPAFSMSHYWREKAARYGLDKEEK